MSACSVKSTAVFEKRCGPQGVAIADRLMSAFRPKAMAAFVDRELPLWVDSRL
jgi:hypothetical protein